jgi:hypothetical protein
MLASRIFSISFSNSKYSKIRRTFAREALAGGLVQPGVERLAGELPAPAVVLGQDLGFSGSKDAVEAAQHGHGQHDALVLRRPVRPAQQVGDLPDQVREIVVVRQLALSLAFYLGSVLKFRTVTRPPSALTQGNPAQAAPYGPGAALLKRAI